MNESPEIKEPRIYHFDDWDFFCRDVLQYHMATRPNDQLISDYIETFVKYMASNVIKYLGDLMAPHSRYNTTEGRDVWLNRVRTIVSDQDKSAELPLTLGECRSRYKAKTTNLSGFWTRSDRLVLLGEITSEEQREYFWESLSWKVQAELVKRCPYVDPRHDVWKGEDTATVKEAEQIISWTIKALECEDSIASCTNQMLITVAVIVVCCVLLVIAAFSLPRYLDSLWIFILICESMAGCAIVALACSLKIFSEHLPALGKLRRLRHKRSQASST